MSPPFGLWSVGVVAGVIAGLLVLRSRHAITWVTLTAGVLAIDGLIVGAKLHYRLENFPLGVALRIPLPELLASGVRIPLGLVLGGIFAGVWCLVWRSPWRDVGDALAVAATAMIPIGRLGCWINRCCTGTVCSDLALPFCIRLPPGTDAYNRQLGDRLITLGDPLSLPAHPLPLYFAAGSLAILLVLFQLHRRHAPPGTMLLAACVLGSAGKLLLEPLRAEPRPHGLMLGIPAAVLVVASVVAATALQRRRKASLDQQPGLAGARLPEAG